MRSSACEGSPWPAAEVIHLPLCRAPGRLANSCHAMLLGPGSRPGVTRGFTTTHRWLHNHNQPVPQPQPNGAVDPVPPFKPLQQTNIDQLVWALSTPRCQGSPLN